MSTLTAVDLFAGGGGTSTGARSVGIEVIVAANHWPVAVETHRKNHPDVDHFTQDLQQAAFHTWPDFDVLMASPACQGHSKARGKERPHHDGTRSTAWAVIACAEAKQPKYVAVENVPDFLRWRLYPHWRSCLECLGYRVAEQVIDAADCGVPQERERLFITAVRWDVHHEPLRVARPGQAHVGAETILQEVPGDRWSRVESTRCGPRAPRVLAQVEWGRRYIGRRFVCPYFGSGSGWKARPLSRPLGTVTTTDRYALVDGAWMRMLTAREYARAQGFEDSYVLPRAHKEAVKVVGNAVPPPLAAHVLGTFTAHHAAKSWSPLRRGA